MELDLVIRGGTVVTASDVGQSDIGVKGGRIVAPAENLPRAATEIDASGRLVPDVCHNPRWRRGRGPDR